MPHINKHTAEFEPPDLVRVIVRGPLLPEEMAEIAGYIRRCSAGPGYVLLLGDISAFSNEGTSAESRRVAAEVSLGIPYRGMALHGGRALQRVVLNAIIRAINMFTKRDNPTRFFDTEQEARAWIDERRRVLQAELAGGRGRKA